MAFSLRRPARLPAPILNALELGAGERVLAWGREQLGATVVATNHHLYAVDAAGQRQLARPWHEVDAGTWSSELGQLTVTWVDGSTPRQWTLGDATLVPETVRERVQASVVIAQRVELGPRRNARVVIRQNLATGDLVEQVVLGRGVRPDDDVMAASTAEALADLREQVGLD
ncbi:MAG TPA: hypothetical protein VGN48_02440 [Pedococcus sp.]|jgi:hypothetical protein|nr:hypothetical protein [Pedococcus sp.]